MGKVFVPDGESREETAVLLLAEAENQGLPADAVGATDGGFLVDKELADKAKADYDRETEPTSRDAHDRAAEVRESEGKFSQAKSPAETGEGNEEPERKTAKKTAKKSAAKKTAKKSGK